MDYYYILLAVNSYCGKILSYFSLPRRCLYHQLYTVMSTQTEGQDKREACMAEENALLRNTTSRVNKVLQSTYNGIKNLATIYMYLSTQL